MALRGSRGKREGREGSEKEGGHMDLPGTVTLKWWTQSEDTPGQGWMNRVRRGQTVDCSSADSTEV